jgi:hypothetical protein
MRKISNHVSDYVYIYVIDVYTAIQNSEHKKSTQINMIFDNVCVLKNFPSLGD